MSVLVRAGRLAVASAVVIGVAAVPARATAPAAPVDYSGVIATLEQRIPEVMAETGAVGMAIALVDGDRTVWLHGFGWADREAGTPVTPTTMFQIGSASKTMTAAAVMQLVQEGKVDLDAPISRYVPELRLRPRFADNTITVRSIMTHQSGIPEDVLNLAEFGAVPDRGMYDKVVAQLSTMLPERRVGDAWAYSNLGITLLQGVIENVSGESFIDYANRHVFSPTGMTSTTFDDVAPFAFPMARTYGVVPTEDGSLVAVRRPREYVNIMAAGSVVSNAVDMAKYLKMMIRNGLAPNGNRILESATVKEMITPQPTSPWDLTFFKPGLVWWIGYTEPWSTRIVNHGGDTTFFHSMVAYDPGSKVGVFVSTNTAAPGNPRTTVSMLALKLMIEAKTGTPLPSDGPAIAPEIPADQAQLDTMAGTYANNGGIVTVTPVDAQVQITLAAQSSDATPSTFSLRSDGWFCPVGESTDACYQPRVIEGQRTLVMRAPAGWEALFAQAIPADYAIPAAWRKRVGTYETTGVSKGIHPDSDTTGMPHTLAIVDGLLMLDDRVLLPAGPNRAFTFGPKPGQVMREAGFAVEAKGRNLSYFGLILKP